MMKNSPEWLPAVNLRESTRSRRITLRISVSKGLELIVPKRTSKKKAFEFLQKKLGWIKKHLDLLKVNNDPIVLPSIINLATINEQWSIHYSDSQRSALKIDQATCGLYFQEGLDPNEMQRLLRQWLIKKAKKELAPMIRAHSIAYNLPFASLSVRLQRSRWGSCSYDKNISLNSKLLLLPQEITHYIIVHELTHTIHLDHSPRFWNHVASIVPNHYELRTDLKKIEQELPNWVY